MVLERKQKIVRKRVKGVALFLGRFFSPNQLSFASLVFSFICFLSFSLNHLALGVFLALLVAFFDVFDGLVARYKDIHSKKGDFLDHTVDRVADALVLLGLSFSKFVGIEIGFLAIIGVLMTGYVGTQAQAIGEDRVYRGIVSRPDIFFLISLGAILTLFYSQRVYSRYLLDWMFLVLAVFSNITALQRSLIVWKELS
ncbi:CDP-alcohol phosphatidyltransferase family protein [archaeon SCG-AAA382B04]|nr:CDP-alcohol phosphatidyltransferase family protein [archaeon SCG-AAA382B04]